MTKQDRLIEFDHQSPEFGADPWATYRRIRPGCPVGWTESYGGFWVLPGYEDVERAAIDYATFSSDQEDGLIPSQDSGGGRLLPVHSDPPLSTDYRRLINPYFTVRAVAAMEPEIRTVVITAIDRFLDKGACDLIADLAEPVSGAVTMALVGWPLEDWPAVVIPVRELSTHPREHPLALQAAAKLTAVRDRIVADIAARRVSPTQDLVSSLLGGTVDGRPITDEEVAALVVMVIFGGIDATVGSIGNFLMYLDRDRAARATLIASPGMIPTAIEEFLRYETPVQGFARTVTQTCTVGEEELAPGDRVMLLWASANRDESVFHDAEKVVLDRSPNRHLAFGAGVHRCVGATLARTELRIVLEEFLRRVPQFEVIQDGVVPTASAGTIYGRVQIPARF